MPDLTFPDPQPAAPVEPGVVSFAHVWAATDGTLQSALAGLLADQPELREAELTREEWQTTLTAYLKSPRP